MSTGLFLSNTAIQKGWKIAKENIPFFAVIVIILAALSYLDEFLRQIGAGFGTRLLVQLLMFCVQILMSIGIAKIALILLDGKKPTYDELYKNSQYFLNYLAASLIYGFIVILGMIALVIPGIYLSVKYQFYYYYLIEDNCGPIEALKKAGECTKGQWWNLFLFDLTLLLINIIGILALIIGFFWSYPTTLIAHADAYRQLRK